MARSEIESRFRFSSGQVFDVLLGTWTFTREVFHQASMAGRATIALVEEGTALYQEAAQVTLANGQTLNGRQRYRYQRSPHPVNGFDILFDPTQQLFQSLKFSSSGNGRLTACASHLCKADSYFSHYELEGDDTFHVRHTVRGPQKDYVVRTRYIRIG